MNFTNIKYFTNNKRFEWIDYDRGISIILVTYRHCFESMQNSGLNMEQYPFIEYVNVFLFGFRMPLFFIASGIFFTASINKYGYKGYCKNRIYNILYPMIIWGIIQISLQIYFTKYTNSLMSFYNYIDLLINPRTTGQFWYLNALFFVGIIYASLYHFFKINKISQLLIGLILYLFCAYINSIDLKLGFINDISKYYLFFGIGVISSNFFKEKIANQLFTNKIFLFILTILFLIIQYFFTELNFLHNSNYYVENRMPFYFLIVAFIGCALSISISFILKKNDSFKFLRLIGYHSIYIYCMQIIVMSVVRNFFLNTLHLNFIPILFFIILTSGIIIPIILYNFLSSINLWWLFSLKKPFQV